MKKIVTKVGHGVFTWDGSERRSDRYGAFFLEDQPYAGGKVCTASLLARASAWWPRSWRPARAGIVGISRTRFFRRRRRSDGRGVFWLDPWLLYRLHDQTVDVYVEPTSDAPHAAPDLRETGQSVVGVSAEEGSFQVKKVSDRDMESMRLPPKIVRVGDGMFLVEPQKIEAGAHVEVLVGGRKIGEK